MTLPVLIVGAGPVGLTMACELARYGIALRIVDRAARRTDQSKALVLWSRTLELLERGGRAGRFVAAGRQADAANFVVGGKVIGRASFATVDSAYRFALMLPQSETERLLEEHLQSLGVSVERQVEVTALDCRTDGVFATLHRADGTTEVVDSDWLIGCDGAHSVVRHALWVPFDGVTRQTDWLLADIHVDGYPFPESELTTWWHEEGVLAVFPIGPRRFRVLTSFGDSSDRASSTPVPCPTLEQVQAIVARRCPAGLCLSEPVWLSGFRINERKVRDYRVGRVFFAGDAAHVHGPAGGQGMNTVMQDAFNLAWKLALVCRGTSAESILDSYSAERSAVGDQVLKAASRMTDLATMRNPAARVVRNVVGHVMLASRRFARRWSIA